MLDLTNFDFDELFGFGDDSNPLMMLIWILPIILFVFYGQRIQLYVTSNDIKKSIGKLNEYKDESKKELINFVKNNFKLKDDPTKRIEMFLDYFSIMPVDMDPNGIVPKVQHFIRSKDDYTRAHVKSLHPEISDFELSKIQTLLEIASTLQLLYKVINHLFLTAKKQNNFPLILPLQMMLPFIMEQAEALKDAIPAFKAGQPVGDGIGPMVVGKMMLNTIKKESSFQTVFSETEFDGRKLYLLKAEGPLSTVGRLGDAVKNLTSDHKFDAIIMIDAALKMEGEESATIARGFGAAIGGIGVERFYIEEAATAKNIPIFSIIVRQTAKEAIGLMTKEIADTADDVRSQVYDVIKENTQEGQSILVIGVGNTMGVPQ